jgi:putative heme-binding domain-containing protein
VATAVGKLPLRTASDALLTLARDPDAGVRGASLDALRRLREPRVVPLAVAALTDRATEVPALECLADLGGPDQTQALTDLARRSPSTEVLSRVVRLLSNWAGKEGVSADERRRLDQAVAEVHGGSGVLLLWSTRGPLTANEAPPLIKRFGGTAAMVEGWQPLLTTAGNLRVRPGGQKGAEVESVWLAVSDVAVAEPTEVQLLAAGNGTLRVWLNGKLIYERKEVRPFQADSDRFSATLGKGTNRLLVQVSGAKVPEFQVRFRRVSAKAEHERLTHLALTRGGDAERGRKVFFDAEKSQCIKCHRLGDQGERIGPELTGVGSRFSRIHIVESILEPSRTIAPSFETLIVTLKNGKLVTGVKIEETEQTLTLGDDQGRKHVLARADIEERRVSPVSTMPEGLEKRLTEDEFIDLIAFLASRTETRPR